MGCLVGDESRAMEEKEEKKEKKDEIQPEEFAKDVLGFEEIQDEDEDAETQEQLVYAEDTGSVPVEVDEQEEASPDSQLKGKGSQEI